MIAKVVGKVDGDKIIFKRGDGGYWSAVIPRDKHGEYAVSITAYDDAGNEAHKSTVLFSIDSYNVDIRVIPTQYTFTHEVDQYGNIIAVNYRSDFVYRQINRKVSMTYAVDKRGETRDTHQDYQHR